uniref:Uncharacterized protein n=1 Tax=Anguilla anguilla TaxID=7936 RepID=A0A0E9R7Z3_ANGAN
MSSIIKFFFFFLLERNRTTQTHIQCSPPPSFSFLFFCFNVGFWDVIIQVNER